MRRAIATSAAAVLALGGLAACGDDGDDTAGSPDAFCEQLRALDAEDAEGLESEAALDRLEELIAIAPQEVRGDLQVLHDAFSGSFEPGEGGFPDEDEIAEIFIAGERVERYGVEECGLEPSDDLDGGIDADRGDADDVEGATADVSGDGSPVPEADPPEPAGRTCRSPAGCQAPDAARTTTQ